MVLGQSQPPRESPVIHMLMFIFNVSDQLIAIPFTSSKDPESQNSPDTALVKNELSIKLWPPVTLKAQTKRQDVGKD